MLAGGLVDSCNMSGLNADKLDNIPSIDPPLPISIPVSSLVKVKAEDPPPSDMISVFQEACDPKHASWNHAKFQG